MNLLDKNIIKHTLNSKGYFKWDILAESADSLDALTPLEKSQIKKSITFFNKHLGKDFLEKAFNQRHPIWHNIFNHAPWTRRWFIWLAKAMKNVSECKNNNSLLNKIKSAKQYAEGLTELEIAYKLYQAGFKITIEPEIIKADNIKRPDLKIANKREQLIVEISQLYNSQAEMAANIIFDGIWEQISIPANHLLYSGRIHKALSVPHFR